MSRYLNHYVCNHVNSLNEGEAGAQWDDVWNCMCNDKCPVCNHEIEPYESDEVDSNGDILETVSHVPQGWEPEGGWPSESELYSHLA